MELTGQRVIYVIYVRDSTTCLPDIAIPSDQYAKINEKYTKAKHLLENYKNPNDVLTSNKIPDGPSPSGLEP